MAPKRNGERDLKKGQEKPKTKRDTFTEGLAASPQPEKEAEQVVQPPPSSPNSKSDNPEDNVVVGIDLGTTFSCVAVWRDGKVDVLENAEGERTTPSFVSFAEDGERFVGQPAKAQAARNVSRTMFNVKRIIGQSCADTYQEIKLLPFPVIEDKQSGMPVIELEYGGSKHSFKPEEISAMVLEKMKATAEKALGHKVTKAVVTVPAYFNDAQRRATKMAGRIAGLTVERIINEPTAAALAYGLDKKGEGLVLVFDLGGGTFDVSLLKIEGGMFQVLATAGDTHLGGEDFDNALQDHIRDEIKQKRGGVDLFADNPKALRQLRTQCEKAKRTLSLVNSASIEININNEDYETTVTRATFEKLNEKLFEKCFVSVRRVLEDAKVAKEDVDDLVLVGGSTRIPKLQNMLSEMFGGKNLCKSVNPDEAVAYGAAVQGAILSGVRNEKFNQLVLLDVIPLTLGIETEGRVFAKVVPRNTPVPCCRTREFTTVEDYQTEVEILVFEGERGCTDGNHLLGEFRIVGIERAKQGVAKVEVTFEVNVNGLLTVTARDRTTGAKADITIKDRSRLSDDEIERMIKEAERMRLDDERRVKEAEAELYGEEEEDIDF